MKVITWAESLAYDAIPMLTSSFSCPGVLLCIADAFATARSSLGLGLKVTECRLDRQVIVRPFVRSFVRLLAPSLARSFVRSFVRVLECLFLRLLVYPLYVYLTDTRLCQSNEPKRCDSSSLNKPLKLTSYVKQRKIHNFSNYVRNVQNFLAACLPSFHC